MTIQHIDCVKFLNLVSEPCLFTLELLDYRPFNFNRILDLNKMSKLSLKSIY